MQKQMQTHKRSIGYEIMHLLMNERMCERESERENPLID